MLPMILSTLTSNALDFRTVSPNCILVEARPRQLELNSIEALETIEIDSRLIGNSNRSLLETIASACDFPPYFSLKWAALSDSLEELPYNRGSNIAILFSDFDYLTQVLSESDFEKLTDTFDDIGSTLSDPDGTMTVSAVFCRGAI